MLSLTSHDLARAELEVKLREAEKIHRMSRPVEHSRLQSMLKCLQTMLARV